MATIRETLDEIPKIQKGLSKEVEGKTLDAKFLNDINHFLSLHYLDLLAHGCMALKWTPLIGQRGSVFKVESDNIIMLPVRAV